MNLLDRAELEGLMSRVEGPCLSVCLTTARTGLGFQQDPTRLRNLLRTAEERLVAAGVRGSDARKLLAPAQKLVALINTPGSQLARVIKAYAEKAA